MKCNHPMKARVNRIWRIGGGDVMRWFDAASFETPDAIQCLKCGDAYLPLGDSDEHASEAVEIEIRAAEIAQSTIEHGADPLVDATLSDMLGWQHHKSGTLPFRVCAGMWCLDDRRVMPGRKRAELAGYLARCIATHDGGDA